MAGEIFLRIDVTADVSEFINIMRFAEKNRPLLLRTAAERYLRWMTKRFVAFSAGGGHWPELKETTILRKEARAEAINPYWILRESDNLLNNFSIKEDDDGIWVGYHGDEPDHSISSESMIWLVEHHAVDNRDAVAPPDRATKRQMTEDIRKEFRKVVKRMNRKGKQ